MPSTNHDVKEEPIPSVKDLASSEPSLRRHCLTTILDHLKSRSPNHPPTTTQSLQLWRAFSVALYMHDSKSAVSVQNLIKTLASTLTIFHEKDVELQHQPPSHSHRAEADDRPPTPSSASASTDASTAEQWIWLSRWTTSFYQTLSREWPTIDQHRMNKYLLLIRFVLRQTFSIISSHLSHLSHTSDTSISTSTAPSPLLTTQLHILRSYPLSPRDRNVPDGLRLHILDIWLDELDQLSTAGSSDDDLKQQLMQPVRELARDAMSKSVRMRAKDVVQTFDDGGRLDGGR